MGSSTSDSTHNHIVPPCITFILFMCSFCGDGILTNLKKYISIHTHEYLYEDTKLAGLISTTYSGP